MPTDIASNVLCKTETGAQITNDGLAELTTIGSGSTALLSVEKVSIVDWRKVFSKLVTWFHSKQSEINTSLYEDAQRRESAGLPPRWR